MSAGGRPASRPCARAALAAAACALGASAAALAQGPAGCEAASLSPARFQDHGDGTVSDRVSGLMWMRCSVGQQPARDGCTGHAAVLSWPEAQRDAERLNRDGAAFYADWRLPSLRELATITDRGCARPRTHPLVFPGTAPAPYWTATPRPGDRAGERAFALSFGDEGVVLADARERLRVRLVRTGP